MPINVRTALCFESALRNLIFVVGFPGGFLAYKRKQKVDELRAEAAAELSGDRTRAPPTPDALPTQQHGRSERGARPWYLDAALNPLHTRAQLGRPGAPPVAAALFSSLAEASQPFLATRGEQQRYLTASIQRSSSLHRLLHLLSQDPALVNHVHITAVLLQLAKLAPNPPPTRPRPRGRPPPAARAVAAHVADQLLHHQPLAALPLEDLTALLYALAKSRCNDPRVLHKVCALLRAQLPPPTSPGPRPHGPHAPPDPPPAAAATATADDPLPKHLANAAWALATLRHRDPQLLRQIADAAAPRAAAFTTQGLANLSWAFATLGHADQRLLAAVADALLAAPRRRPRPEELTMLAWAHARLHPPAPTGAARLPPEHSAVCGCSGGDRTAGEHPVVCGCGGGGDCASGGDAGLWAYLAGEAAAQMDHFTVQGACNLAWALARVGFQPPDYFRSLAQHLASQPPSSFAVEAITSVAATFAPHYHAPLFATLSAAAAAAAPRMSLGEVLAVAQALAAVPHYDRAAFWALGARVLHLRDRLTFEAAAQLARAFAAVPHADPRLWEALRGAAAEGDAASAPVSAVAGMLWGVAAAGEARRCVGWCLAACQRLAGCSPWVVAAAAEAVGEGFWPALADLRRQLLLGAAAGADGEGAGGDGGVDPVTRGQLVGLLDALLAGEAARSGGNGGGGQRWRAAEVVVPGPRGLGAGGQQHRGSTEGPGRQPGRPAAQQVQPQQRARVQVQQQLVCAALAQLGLAPGVGVLEAGGRVRVDVAVQYRGVPVAVLLPGEAGWGAGQCGQQHVQQLRQHQQERLEQREALERAGWLVLEVEAEELERLAVPEEACHWLSQRLLGLAAGGQPQEGWGGAAAGGGAIGEASTANGGAATPLGQRHQRHEAAATVRGGVSGGAG